MKPKWLERSLITGPYYTLCLSEEAFRAELKRLGVTKPVAFILNDHSDATAHYLTADNGNRCCIVCLRGMEKHTGIEIAGLLVHEATHIWQDWCEQVGEQTPGIETEAYAIQWISQQLMWEYARQTGVTA